MAKRKTANKSRKPAAATPKSSPKKAGRKPASRQKATADLFKLNSELTSLIRKQARSKGAKKGQATRAIKVAKRAIKAAKGRLYRAKNRGKGEYDKKETLRKENKKASRGKSSTKGTKTSKTSKSTKTKKTTKTRSKSKRK